MDVHGLKYRDEHERLAKAWTESNWRDEEVARQLREHHAKPGSYFRATIFSWPGVVAVADAAIALEGLDIDTDGWHHNDGCGLRAQEECDQLADAMERVLAEGDGVHAEAVMATAKPEQGGQSLLNVLRLAGLDTKLISCGGPADLVLVREFIGFLRECGGFEIH